MEEHYTIIFYEEFREHVKLHDCVFVWINEEKNSHFLSEIINVLDVHIIASSPHFKNIFKSIIL